MRRSFKRDFDALSDIFDFVGGFAGRHEVGEDAVFSINLAAEEIFTNMVKYNTGGRRDISVRLDRQNNAVLLELVDEDVDPIEPISKKAVGVRRPLAERVPGGLGLHLVKSVVDEIAYTYDDRVMTVTVIKNLG